MNENKKTYYVGMASGEITQSDTGSPWDFKIEATDQEIFALREIFNQNYSAEWQSFFRAHLPFLEYHYDQANDKYDDGMMRAYQMIYQLGDAEAKKHIESLGIIQ